MIVHIIAGFLCLASPISLASIIIQEQAVCGANELACGDGTCVSLERVCDGSRDCLDGQDEANCLTNPTHDISPEPGFLVHRSKRQSSRCGKLQWACRDGQCIDFDGKCDGVVDCNDRSDETHALCRGLKCQSFWFRCTYGACVDGDAACNGRSDCADQSDEIGPQCRMQPDVINNQFRCQDGTFIPSSDKCDGNANCLDGSDESIRACGNLTCPSYLFQCAYGACVDQGSECNGVQDCFDGSDESSDLCGKGTVPILNSKLCVLPPYPSNGRYTVEGRPNAGPGLALEYARVNVQCNRNYGTKNMMTEYVCTDGKWSNGQVVPSECVRQCLLDLNRESVEYKDCIFPDTVNTAQCTPKVPSGTIVQRPTCREPNYYSDNQLSEMTCFNGQWDFMPQCRPECGRVTPRALVLVVNGTTATHGELPWHVGIYRRTITAVGRQICGGSIIKNNLVISAAHCFWNATEKISLPASNFAVAAGKIYKPWNDAHDTDAQKSEVEKIISHSSFRAQDNNYANDIALLMLAQPFKYLPYILPVCLRFDHKFETTQLTPGKLGKVAGWGLTSANGSVAGKLQTTELPFVPEMECNKKAPVDFKPYIVADKICAGYDDGTTTLCQGDSGGGLVFSSEDFGVKRYYLRGIVSASPQSTTNCNVKAIIAFTKISAHEEFIRPYIRDIS